MHAAVQVGARMRARRAGQSTATVGSSSVERRFRLLQPAGCGWSYVSLHIAALAVISASSLRRSGRRSTARCGSKAYQIAEPRGRKGIEAITLDHSGYIARVIAQETGVLYRLHAPSVGNVTEVPERLEEQRPATGDTGPTTLKHARPSRAESLPTSQS